jgi:hypothetical protein
VEFPEPDQLLYRLGVVVDAQVQRAIIVVKPSDRSFLRNRVWVAVPAARIDLRGRRV